MGPYELGRVLRDGSSKILVVLGLGVDTKALEPYRDNPQVVIREATNQEEHTSLLGDEPIKYVVFVGAVPKLALLATIRGAERRGIETSGEATWYSQTAVSYLRNAFLPIVDTSSDGSLRSDVIPQSSTSSRGRQPPRGGLTIEDVDAFKKIEREARKLPSAVVEANESVSEGEDERSSGMKRVKRQSLRDFIREESDLSRDVVAGQEIDRLLSLARKNGFATTKGSVSFTFYSVRKEQEGGKGGKSGRVSARDKNLQTQEEKGRRNGDCFRELDSSLHGLRVRMEELSRENEALKREQAERGEVAAHLRELQELFSALRDNLHLALTKINELTGTTSSPKARKRTV